MMLYCNIFKVPRSFRRLQLAGGSRPCFGNRPAQAPAAPPHQHAGHREYQRKRPGQEHDELPDRPAVTAFMDPAYPPCGAVAGEWSASLNRAVAIVDRDGDDLAPFPVAQLHAPDRAGTARTALTTPRAWARG